MENNQELIKKIKDIKDKLKGRVVIPAHHYQRNEIVSLADFVGDSYILAKESAKTKSDYIVFCGVRFMAESAKILSSPEQKVLIPDMSAGCPMADMIDTNTAVKIFDIMQSRCSNPIVPVVYMNSYADMKSFCGEREGSVCTSSNAKKIIEYYFSQNKSVFFFPDYHLGKNIANTLKIDEKYVVKVKKDGTLISKGDVKEAKIFLYDGFCPVHRNFTESDVLSFLRKKNSDINIIVHPECDESVVNIADRYGSTEQIYKAVKDSPEGSMWAIGTEYNFVNRMAQEFKDKVINPLKVSPCPNMEKITLQKLHESLLSIVDFENSKGDLKYEIFVDRDYVEKSQTALRKMIEITEK